ncbi:hypothetical protein FA15DRAFT_606329 [Coprinopsis marcescibilis]|uniref:Uncharacterized protein n=1 Tax=Coprinopsis marcescibilis TaxID=230819 RepID=A0A5C3K9T4_COPMA|nr:hypothetical protein FA15DRAFT_606329 [Coprinopsis marcescibilis]
MDPDDPDNPSSLQRFSANPFGMFNNLMCFQLCDWYWNSGTQKSLEDFQKLARILTNPQFSAADVASTNWKRLFHALGANAEDVTGDESQWIDDDGWRTTPISIPVPFHQGMQNSGAPLHLVGDLYHRDILQIIEEVVADPRRGPSFHFKPYEVLWQPNGCSEPVRVYGELYNSDAFLGAHQELLDSPGEPECTLERVIAGLMLWSDATELTAFGGAKLWPCYMYLGNESKYRRSKHGEHLGHHIAYFSTISDEFNDYLKTRSGGRLPPDHFFAYCHREIYHEQWKIILSDELLHAMEHGIVLMCYDGVRRRFYPRIFTYSADYPEKVILATIRGSGAFCPCPRCLVKKEDLWKMGTAKDIATRTSNLRVDTPARQQDVIDARTWILGHGRATNYHEVEAILKPTSTAPVINAFSRLSGVKFNIFSSLVVDLLHEFEIGIWKNLFIHLIRILNACCTRTENKTAELDHRYRMTPSFGNGTIRRFGLNASEFKRKAARDYEDLLQCAIPAFDGLIPAPHNEIVMKLLKLCAEWHALAKLRMHTDLTLELLEETTTAMAAQFRLFLEQTCAQVVTFELPKEAEARRKREQSRKDKASTSSQIFSAPPPSARKRKTLNINTYKYHALGDYVSTIKKFGTTDSFNSDIGEFNHKDPKSWYLRTDKRDYRKGISRVERRRARIQRVKARLENAYGLDPTGCAEERGHQLVTLGFVQEYRIGSNENLSLELSQWMVNRNGIKDPALTVFVPQLKQHLLPRVCSLLEGEHYQEADIRQCLSYNWTSVVLSNNRIFSHKLMKISYTAYDVRLDEDILHVDTPRSNVMMLNASFNRNNNDSHPFVYAKVLGIFHADVSFLGFLANGHRDLSSRRLEFLWVHWYQLVEQNCELSLDRVSLLPTSSPSAFGFIDPASVVRCVHIIPQFSQKRIRPDGQATSAWANDAEAWKFYFINKFVDRDMYMRYNLGIGVGHTYGGDGFRYNQRSHSSTASSDSSVLVAPLDQSPNNHVSDYHFHLSPEPLHICIARFRIKTFSKVPALIAVSWTSNAIKLAHEGRIRMKKNLILESMNATTMEFT